MLLGGYLFEKRVGTDSYRCFQPPGRRVDIGGRRLYVLVQGERQPGQPLVVLEAGHGDWSKAWQKVQPEIARFARVLSYDRAGSGWSDPGPLPRTPEAMVHDLHDLLAASGEAGPYLLVGHSMGAPLSRLFFHFYPHEVLGMVWVDSAHERMDRFLPFFPAALSGLQSFYRSGRIAGRLGLVRLLFQRQMLKIFPNMPETAAQQELLAQVNGARYFDWMYAETAGFARGDDWKNVSRCLGALPVISLEAQYTTQPPPPMAVPYWKQFLVGWKKIHADVAGLSTRLRRVPVDAGHVIMAEQPEVVVQAVRDLLEQV
jgi:pimeloyl-ACP methyl ester carboxylesterase